VSAINGATQCHRDVGLRRRPMRWVGSVLGVVCIGGRLAPARAWRSLYLIEPTSRPRGRNPNGDDTTWGYPQYPPRPGGTLLVRTHDRCRRGTAGPACLNHRAVLSDVMGEHHGRRESTAVVLSTCHRYQPAARFALPHDRLAIDFSDC
jgi:hypothetical protein